MNRSQERALTSENSRKWVELADLISKHKENIFIVHDDGTLQSLPGQPLVDACYTAEEESASFYEEPSDDEYEVLDNQDMEEIERDNE